MPDIFRYILINVLIISPLLKERTTGHLSLVTSAAGTFEENLYKPWLFIRAEKEKSALNDTKLTRHAKYWWACHRPHFLCQTAPASHVELLLDKVRTSVQIDFLLAHSNESF